MWIDKLRMVTSSHLCSTLCLCHLCVPLSSFSYHEIVFVREHNVGAIVALCAINQCDRTDLSSHFFLAAALPTTPPAYLQKSALPYSRILHFFPAVRKRHISSSRLVLANHLVKKAQLVCKSSLALDY